MKLALILLFVIQFLWIGGNSQRVSQSENHGINQRPHPPKYSPVQLGGSSGVSTFELFKEIIAKVFINEITMVLKKYI